MKSISTTVAALLVASVSTTALSHAAQAQTVTTPQSSAAEEPVTEVIVTGTRRAERTVFDSSVPVDVVDASDLRSVPSADLNDKLAQLVPSFNVQRLPLADGLMFTRPATLRGLAPDQTLVLVNGVRRHRSAYVDSAGETGSQAVDLSQIPQIALRRIEVLRDGAAAQYGSDAIAGVINLILEDRPGLAFESQVGEYFEGDGNSLQLAGRGGWALGDFGKASLSVEYSNADPTDRGRAVNRIGQPALEALRSFYTFELELPLASLYSFGNYGHTTGWGDFNHRNANNNVFARSYFQDNPPFLHPDYDLASRYPNGFTPQLGSKSDDASAVVGLRGDLATRLSWDLSARYGRNEIGYYMRNSINAALGPASPTDFYIGDWIQSELGATLGFNYGWEAGLPEPVNVAFGGEWRQERFEVVAGEPDAYRTGDFPDLIPGSNGFPGFAPEQAGRWHRDSVAAYLDVDAELSERLNLGAAVRFENYSDFGSTWNYKISTRYRLLRPLNLRAALSTGFRAPTPGQQDLVKTSQGPDPTRPPPAPQVITTAGLIPSRSPIAALVGGRPLEPEESVNYSVGLVFQPDAAWTVSVDLYRIDIDSRLGTSPSYKLTEQQRAYLLSLGVTEAARLDEFNFFTNAYDTRTQGIDVVGSWSRTLGPGNLRITGAYNHNRTQVRGGDPDIANASLRQTIEDRLPHDAGNLTFNYDVGRLGLMARGRAYGPWIDAITYLPPEANQRVGNEAFLDLAVSFSLTPSTTLTVGAENVFDNYPDENRTATARLGRRYPMRRAFDADGGRYYARLIATF